jgi:LAO/AO transport system kinase
LGDDVQAGKAGLLEIADILVVNKSDRPGAEASARALENALAVGAEMNGNSDDGWQVPVVRVSALHGEGLPELVDAIYAHRRHLQDGRGWAERKNRRARSGLVWLLKESLYTAWQTRVSEDALDEMAAKIAGGALSPEQAAERLLET